MVLKKKKKKKTPRLLLNETMAGLMVGVGGSKAPMVGDLRVSARTIPYLNRVVQLKG